MIAGTAQLIGDNTGLLGGSSLIVWLVLALGAAMFFGNVMAIVRPPARSKDGELERAPVGRSALMAAVGALAAIWALASLIS